MAPNAAITPTINSFRSISILQFDGLGQGLFSLLEGKGYNVVKADSVGLAARCIAAFRTVNGGGPTSSTAKSKKTAVPAFPGK